MEIEHQETSDVKEVSHKDTDSVAEQKETKEEKEEKIEEEYEEVDYKDKYKNLKRKLKSLLYEQECFHEELRKIQRKCLRVSRDKSFLLDRLLQYEQPEDSSDEELTDSSSAEEEEENEIEVKKKEKSKIQNAKRSKFQSKPSKDNQTSSTSTVERSRCKYFENNKQCVKMVSKKIKSGICQTHRQLINKQDKLKETKEDNSKTQPKTTQQATPTTPTTIPTTTRKPPIGGKDINQIKEAMEASSKIEDESSSENENEDNDLVIDLPH